MPPFCCKLTIPLYKRCFLESTPCRYAVRFGVYAVKNRLQHMPLAVFALFSVIELVCLIYRLAGEINAELFKGLDVNFGEDYRGVYLTAL